MKPILLCATISLACAADITPQSYLDHVKYLASPELKGRATGTPELEKAASYIAAQFKSAGLKPAVGGNYEQSLPVVTEAKLGPGNHLYILNGAREDIRTFSGYV